MRQQTRVRLYDVHASTGAALGVFLFALCFSGSVALFVDELAAWERPSARAEMPERPAVDAAIRAFADRADGRLPPAFLVHLPGPSRPTIVLDRLPSSGDTARRRIEADAATGRLVAPLHEGVGRFLRSLHTDLHLPAPWGRYLVGLGGIAMLLSLVTGVATHAKILTNLHVFRPDRSRRLAWADAHRVLGVWALPFHAMIAFSGAILGLAGLLLAVLALAAFSGDRDRAVEAIAGAPPVATGEPAAMASLDAILADARARSPEAAPTLIDIRHWGDAGAEARVRVEGFPTLKWYAEHRYALATGRHRESWSLGATAGGRVYAALTPLHYGSFGGLALKALYAVLGLLAAMAIATGLVVWLERRRQRGRPVSARLSGLVVGAMAGMGLATAGALAAHHAVPDDGARVFRIGVVYVGLWIGAAALAAGLGDDRRATRLLLRLTAALFLAAPLLRMLAEGGPGFGPGTLAANATDAALLSFGLGTAVAARAVPRSPSAAVSRPGLAAPAE